MNVTIKNLPGEIWKEIDGYDGYYEVSNMGRLMSWHRGRCRLLKSGGGAVNLWLNNKHKQFMLHNLVWDYFGFSKRNKFLLVSHKNKCFSDNRIENLELVNYHDKTNKEVESKKIKLKYHGAYWNKQRGKWVSRITVGKKQIHLGCFDTESEACKAYIKAVNLRLDKIMPKEEK